MKKQAEERKAELLDIIDKMDPERQLLAIPLADELTFLESQLYELKKLPFIKVNPSNPALQKQTEAARQYTKLSSSYIQTVKLLSGLIGKTIADVDDSPLAGWLKAAGEYFAEPND